MELEYDIIAYKNKHFIFKFLRISYILFKYAEMNVKINHYIVNFSNLII